MLLAVAGMVGTGKTTLSRAIAARFAAVRQMRARGGGWVLDRT